MASKKSTLWKITYYANRTTYDKEISAYLADKWSVQIGIVGIMLLISWVPLGFIKAPVPLIITVLAFGFFMSILGGLSAEISLSKLKKNKALTLKKEVARKKEEEILLKEAEIKGKIYEKASLRDAEQQNSPYTYEIGRHGNETLALRYGIANINNSTGQESLKIRIQKIRRAGMIFDGDGNETSEKNCYLAKLPDFRNREVLAIIEPGTEYVKTFYPLRKSWFENNKHLEETLKGNSTMSLKEVATFHILKAAI